MVAPAGAGPWPQITSGCPLRTSNRTTGTSPPGPLRWGSTTWSVNAVAQAASKALPPFSSTDMPTAVAIQWVEVTTPNVPSISGRVVNGFGLILDTPALMTANLVDAPPPPPPCRRRRFAATLGVAGRSAGRGEDHMTSVSAAAPGAPHQSST